MITQTIQTTTSIFEEQTIPALVSELLGQFTALWWQTPDNLPDLGTVYSPRDQQAREKHLESTLKKLVSELRRKQASATERQAVQEKVAAILVDFAKEALGINDSLVETIRSYGFAEIAVEFDAMAHHFDPAVSDEDIFQASRNVWSMNLMQLLLGQPIQMTPAIFAYSMLYPYSDNYLDNPAIPLKTKHGFNHRFQRRLEGEAVTPVNAHEAKICALIDMIEDQFPRHYYPQVFDSLLAIHQAQSKSLHLLRPGASPYEIDVLGICFEKGGTSVLADGYLIAGTLTRAQQEFMFYYGTLTQIMDDLEDVERDLKAGLQTIFSHTAQHWPLDVVTNRTFHFAGGLLERMAAFDAPGAEALKELIQSSLTPLLISEAGVAGRLYSPGYRKVLQSHFPYRFSFLEKQRNKFSNRGISPLGIVKILAASQVGLPISFSRTL